MKLIKSVLILAAVAMLASCGEKPKETAPVEDTSADSLKVAAGSYKNETLGYTITYPKDILSLQEGSDEATEQVFAPTEGPARLRIYADKRVDKKTGNELTFNEAYDQDVNTKERQVVQRSLSPTSYIVSGVEGDMIFYQKTIFKKNALVTAKLTYTKDEKNTFDAMIASMFGSFK